MSLLLDLKIRHTVTNRSIILFSTIFSFKTIEILNQCRILQLELELRSIF